MNLPAKISSHNFNAFLWHAAFLAFAQNFMDVDTVMPAMVIESGGNAFHVGVITAIMMGGSSFTQLIFAPYISNFPFKKKFLLIGINLRILSLVALGIIMFLAIARHSESTLFLIFLFVTIFALSGAFANISYANITGKSINEQKRKSFFSAKQIISGSIILVSAFIAKKTLAHFEYPVNYGFMFLAGGILLLVASGGYWMVRETIPSVLRINGIREFAAVLGSELKSNRKLVYFLGFINTQGIAVSFLPFVILYAKETFGTTSHDTGLFLLFKVIGIVSVSLLVLLNAKNVRYRVLLYGNVLLTMIMAILVLLINDPDSLKYVFIAGGVVYSLYSITMNGLLLEVSDHHNRALYTGFAGAGNILPAIFPLSAGWLIKSFGYEAFIYLFMVVVALSVYFIYKVDCRK